MLEVPSLLFDLDRIFERVDFISIGTNDLMQFMFAADRDNAMVSSRFDALHPSFLRALKGVADRAHATGVPVSICGEIAGRPAEALTLIGLGFRSFSVSPSGIGPFKAMLHGLDVASVAPLIEEAVANGMEPSALRQKLKPFLPKGE
jgi:phosphotransferase system enzyme I (PtsP)